MIGDLETLKNGVQPVIRHPKVSSVEEVITFQLRKLVGIGEQAGQQWLGAQFGLSLNQWRLLALVKSRNSCRAGDIADLLVMDKSQTSRVIKSLLKLDLIRSRPDQRDGRAIALEMTQAGEAVYQRIFVEVLSSNERILLPLSKEEAQLFHDMLGKLLSHSQGMLEKRLGRSMVR